MKPIDILLIDDEKEYCASLKTNARNFGIRIFDYQNLEDGFKELETSNYKYKALILDGNCLLTAKDEKETSKFLPAALEKLNEFEQRYERHIPCVVNTGYYDRFEIFTDVLKNRRAKMFQKSRPKEEMYTYLLEEISNTEVRKIEREYNDIFDIFRNNYLEDPIRDEMFDLLKNMHSSNTAKISKNLGAIRRVLESIYQALNKSESKIVPDSCFKANKDLRYWEVSRYLSGNPAKSNSYKHTPKYGFTKLIKDFSDTIYKVTSDNGSHNSYETKSLPKKYTVISVVNMLIEVLLWFKEVMDREYAMVEMAMA